MLLLYDGSSAEEDSYSSSHRQKEMEMNSINHECEAKRVGRMS